MTEEGTSGLRGKWEAFRRSSFGRLLRLFVSRMFRGGEEGTAEGLDLGVGAIVVLMAVPGMLVSLLMFEKYGSLIRWMRGDPVFDPFKATAPDEYFFIVLSMVVSGAAALWRWDSIFPDRRDYVNLVPLPIALRKIFLANLCAILFFTALITVVANAASMVLFPVAVTASQGSPGLLLRFAGGHFVGVFTASVFSCSAVFGLTGMLMALLPAAAFRRVSLLARFSVALWLLILLGTSLEVPHWLKKMPVAEAHRVAVWPPVSFLGVSRAIWVGGTERFVMKMAWAAGAALAAAIFAAIFGYALSFRRAFLKIPEARDAGPLPRARFSFSPMAPLLKVILRTPAQKACYRFVARTLLRSEGHLQVVLGFLALGLVAAAGALGSAGNLRAVVAGTTPSREFLCVPFFLSYCAVVGVRFAFAIPADLRANWIFRMWLERNGNEAREIARRALWMFSLSWLAPGTFAVTLAFWGWRIAAQHTAFLVVSTAVLVEILLTRFRKIPFTCAYPIFESHSGLVGVAYLFGFVIFADYLVQIEQWAMVNGWGWVCVAALYGAILAGLHYYRKQMLEMDKELVFEEVTASGF